MKILFFDTETSGLPLYKEPSEDPRQPHIVQLAATLVDDAAPDVVLAAVSLIVKPDGWAIDPETAAIHGITTEHALDTGVPERLVLDAFYGLWQACDRRVAHNLAFDDRIVRIAMKRASLAEDVCEAFKAAPRECTMLASTPVCKLPSANGRGGYKWPKLSEAHRHFFGAEHTDQHSADGDVRALRAIYWKLRELTPA